MLGLVPLALVLLTALKYASARQLHDMLWVCNVANVAVGTGLLAARPQLIRVGALWILTGTAFWLGDALLTGHFEALPVCTHLVTAVIAVVGAAAMTEPHPARAHCLGWALLGLIGIQLLSRMTTPEMANVNFAFTSYYGLWAWFPPDGSYAAFWVALCGLCTACCAAGNGLLSIMTRRL